MSKKNDYESAALFEKTFQQQFNKDGEIEDLKYLFTKKFGNGEDEWPVEPNRYRRFALIAIVWKILNTYGLMRETCIRQKDSVSIQSLI
jgi:hypothetical protein